MDLVDVLRKKIVNLEDGDYLPGLKAVLLHIETAFRHLSRGQEQDEETAFTDAIYRTNQAFEGSVKEAYRVLASQEPAKKTPFEIETYLEQNNIFRPRVLSQLKSYRTGWRNPSTHDYKLDFDESEAFLAIISVSAFSCLLLDQMAERIAYSRAQVETEAQKANLEAQSAKTLNAGILERVTELLKQFCAIHTSSFGNYSGRVTEFQDVGALHGYLSSIAPELTVETDALLHPAKYFRADLLISRDDENVVVELKRRFTKNRYSDSIAQIEQQLHIGGIKNGILLFLPEGPGEVDQFDARIYEDETRIVVLSPHGSSSQI